MAGTVDNGKIRFIKIVLALSAGGAMVLSLFFGLRPGVVPDTHPVNTANLPALHGFDDAKSRKSVEAANRRIKELEQRISDVKNEVNRVNRRMEELNRIVMSGQPDDSQFLAQSARPEALDNETAEQIDYLRKLQEKVYLQQVDVAWSDELESAIEEILLQPEMQGVELADKRCGTTLCQIDLWFDESSVDIDDIDEILSLIADRGEGFATVNEEDANAVLYLSKEGYALFDPQ